MQYSLIRRKGMKNLRAKVDDYGNIIVSAPYGVKVDIIEDFVQKVSDKLEEKARSKVNFSTEIKNGTKIRFFGEVLTVVLSDASTSLDTIRQGKNLILKKNNEDDYLPDLVNFIAKETRGVIAGYLDKYLKISGYKGVTPRLVLKALKSKWGHCNIFKNEIMINFAVIGLPQNLCEYITAHEVAHLFIKNHSKDFYDFGETIFKNFKKTDRLLNKGYSTNLWKAIICTEGEKCQK